MRSLEALCQSLDRLMHFDVKPGSSKPASPSTPSASRQPSSSSINRPPHPPTRKVPKGTDSSGMKIFPVKPTRRPS